MNFVKDRVSIIVPSYNAEKTIKRCIDSLLCQDYSNIEIVLIDDGSTDQTLKVLEKYTDTRLKIFSKANGGVSSARNLGLQMASGEFIAFCDADDFYDKKFLSKMIPFFKPDVCLVSCDCAGRAKSLRSKKTLTFTVSQAMKEIFSDKYLFVYPCNKIYRKIYLKNLKFKADIKFGEDLLFNYEYLKKCPQDLKTVHLMAKLYHYIRRFGSASSISSKKPFSKHKLIYLEKLEEMIVENSNVDKDLTEHIIAWEFLILLQYLIETKNKENKEIHDKFKAMAREKWPIYKKHKNAYRSFRKFGFIYKFI